MKNNRIQRPMLSKIIIILFSMYSGSRGQGMVSSDEVYFYGEELACITPAGGRGQCVDIFSCPMLLALVYSPDRQELLRKSQCGWNKTAPKVCCNTTWECVTPNKELGYCIKFTSCPRLMKMLTSFPVAQDTITILQRHRCGSEEFYVCCAARYMAPNKRNLTLNLNTCNKTSYPPDPSLPCCGRGLSKNKIRGDKVTSMHKFPWTAVIEYVGNYVIAVKCGGTLISGKYVLTAAHCLFVRAWTPVNVRLGDYDIDHPGVDCIKVRGSVVYCTDEPLTITIEKIIPHPDFTFGSPVQPNDIALIKLKDMAPNTDFIRPICLPTSDVEDTATMSVSLSVVGWGTVDEVRSYSPTKHHVTVPLVTREDCVEVYRRFNFSIGEGQICAGGELGKDSCKGDSGGALMLVKEQMTEIVGITSFGYTPCGTENMPAVYTKVHHYLPWIQHTIFTKH